MVFLLYENRVVAAKQLYSYLPKLGEAPNFQADTPEFMGGRSYRMLNYVKGIPWAKIARRAFIDPNPKVYV